MNISTFFMLSSMFFVGFYLILGRRYIDVLFGMALTSNAVNLLLIQTKKQIANISDPLPQALILTAIVIGFALLAFFAAYTLVCSRANTNDIFDEGEQ